LIASIGFLFRDKDKKNEEYLPQSTLLVASGADVKNGFFIDLVRFRK